jgi:hypothetical protein
LPGAAPGRPAIRQFPVDRWLRLACACAWWRFLSLDVFDFDNQIFQQKPPAPSTPPSDITPYTIFDYSSLVTAGVVLAL